MEKINKNTGNALFIWLIIVVVAVGVSGYLIFKGGGQEIAKEEVDFLVPENQETENQIPGGSLMEKGKIESLQSDTVGTYEVYAPEKLSLANNGDVVLFFYASWCPYCRTAESDINENINQIPGDVHILKTNYDTETALKQKYGVTYQHTFVQVDSSGNLIKKWSGSVTLGEIIANIQR